MDKNVIANLKALGIDMINEASSGHPGIVLSAAPIIYTLFANHMHINVKDEKWINRDRFVMSAGHGSALLYAMLYMCGFLSLEDLKAFRQLGSKTPGHPEYKTTPGVDMSTGPLGQGLASAVGMAIGEKHLQTKLPNNLIDYNIYVLCGDGDLMEGVSYEAASLAGTLNLNNLIVLYDANKVSLDGNIKQTFNEDILERFDSMGWFVISTSNKPSDIDKALNKAKRSGLPSFIEVKTTLGDGSLLAGTNEVHGKPLTEEDIKQLKEKLKIPNESFYVNKEMIEKFRKKLITRCGDKYIKWNKAYNEYVINTLNGNDDDLQKFYGKIVDFSLDEIQFDIPEYEAPRDSNHKIMNYLSSKTDLLFGGSADVASSCKIYLDEEGDFEPKNYQGKNIWYGVREHAMGAISNGIALTGYLPFCGTFLTFSDYVKPAIRMSTLMNLPVTYIFTHDSINVGEDGPTHQPIEQLSNLRNIPNFTVYRPADFNEILGTWSAILTLKKPSAIILSKAKTYNGNKTDPAQVINGAYTVLKEKEKIDAILIATGSEVGLAVEIAKELNEFDLRVVSMPSVSQFLKTPKQYQYSVLPPGKKTFFIEAGNGSYLRRFVSNEKYLITLENFGQSGKSEDVLKYNSFDKESIKKKIKDLL